MAYPELKARAAQALPLAVVSYVAGGAGTEHTQRANVSAFRQWGLMPRMLVGATKRDLSVELFGRTLPSPLFMAPIGVIGLCAQDGHGDLATARAAARTGVPMIASTLSNDPLEDVARSSAAPRLLPALHAQRPGSGREPGAPGRGRGLRGHRRHPRYLGHRLAAARPGTSNFPQLRGHCLANYTSDPIFGARLGEPPATPTRSSGTGCSSSETP